MILRQPSLVLLMCCGMTGYFGFHAINGKHGFHARKGLQERAVMLARELEGLEAVRARIKGEVRLLSPDRPDADYVEELARSELGFARRGDVILIERDGRVALLGSGTRSIR